MKVFTLEEITHNYKRWDTFATNKKVGVITTVFSEQFLSKAFKVFLITRDDYAQEIEQNDIDTVFIDNDLFETDHCWYRAPRGHLINYLTRNKKNICVIKNTSQEVNKIFKGRLVLEISPYLDQYEVCDSTLKMPLLLNTDLYNPVNSYKNTDITYVHLGKITTSLQKKIDKSDITKSTELITSINLNRTFLEELFTSLKGSKILYINNSFQLDEVSIRYIEYIAYLNSVYVIYDDKHKLDSIFQPGISSSRAINNKMKILLRNPEFTFKKTLAMQRHILITHTFLIQKNLSEFLINYAELPSSPNISVIIATHRQKNLELCFEQMNKQKHVNLEINVVTHGYELSAEEVTHFKNSSRFPININTANKSESLGMCLNKAVESSSYPVIAKVDDDDYYLDHYLIDQWLALKYSYADVVGKSEAYYYFECEDIIAVRKRGEHLKYGDFIMGATIMMKTEMLKELLFADLPRAIDTDLLRRVNNNSGRIYICHPFEMCVFRSKDIDNHTWQVSNLAILKDAEIIGYGDPSQYVRIR